MIDGQMVMENIERFTKGMEEINTVRIPLMENLDGLEKKKYDIEHQVYGTYFQDYLDDKMTKSKFETILRHDQMSIIEEIRGVKSQISILNKKYEELMEKLYLWKKLTFNTL